MTCANIGTATETGRGFFVLGRKVFSPRSLQSNLSVCRNARIGGRPLSVSVAGTGESALSVRVFVLSGRGKVAMPQVPPVIELLFHYFLEVATGEDSEHKAELLSSVQSLNARGLDGFLISTAEDAGPLPAFNPEWERQGATYRPGYIYLLESKTGFYKIGRTRDLAKRSSYFGLTLPFKVKLISAKADYDSVLAETELHALFTDLRINGEWFDLDKPRLDFLRWYMRPEHMREEGRR